MFNNYQPNSVRRVMIPKENGKERPLGIPTKGTPQGGIISPLLSNIVLNELDWWGSNQWETYKPKNSKSTGFLQYARKYTNLKPGYIVKYADDFKIMCKSYPEAKRYFYAVKDFIETRLKLQINEEKSGVINLNKNSTNFLGFKIKVIKKGNTRTGKIAKTSISDKAINKINKNLNNKINDIQRNQNKDTVMKYNLAVIGIHNYYRIATNVYNNLDDVNYIITKRIKNRLKNNSKIILYKNINDNSKRFMIGVKDNRKIYVVLDIPLCAIKHKSPMNFSQDICNYTESGRAKYTII